MSKLEFDPVIIIGMHRSGTSMVSRTIEALGLFQGIEKDTNNEAFLFQHINDWLLRMSGGAWDYPGPFALLLGNARVRAGAVEFIRKRLASRHAISFFGRSGAINFNTPATVHAPWGWKDPRNTFTLPLWLDIFPNARVIHVLRHGVDVAASLKARTEKIENEASSSPGKNKKLRMNPLFRFHLPLVDTLRCTSLEGGFTLWEEYLCEARAHVQALKDHAIEFRYEDFLADPTKNLLQLVEFCGLRASRDNVVRIADNALTSRAYAYRGNPELEMFAASVAARLGMHGY
ncbi:MAG TPA: sulfotransferase [Nitrospirota bacterium]|nr:sulfotransferase [Nitrospirota bacterium]